MTALTQPQRLIKKGKETKVTSANLLEEMDSRRCPTFVKDGQAGKNVYKKWAIEEDHSRDQGS